MWRKHRLERVSSMTLDYRFSGEKEFGNLVQVARVMRCKFGGNRAS